MVTNTNKFVVGDNTYRNYNIIIDPEPEQESTPFLATLKMQYNFQHHYLVFAP